eukprot:g30394.t1
MCCKCVTSSFVAITIVVASKRLALIRDVYRLHREELDAIDCPDERHKRMVELNVIEQCLNLFKTSDIQSRRRYTASRPEEFGCALPRVHAMVFSPADGILRRLTSVWSKAPEFSGIGKNGESLNQQVQVYFSSCSEMKVTEPAKLDRSRRREKPMSQVFPNSDRVNAEDNMIVVLDAFAQDITLNVGHLYNSLHPQTAPAAMASRPSGLTPAWQALRSLQPLQLLFLALVVWPTAFWGTSAYRHATKGLGRRQRHSIRAGRGREWTVRLLRPGED